MIAILKKELWSYFGNWSAWIVLIAFSIISALFLFFFENNFNVFDISTASLHSFFVLVPWILMFIIPAFSMKSIAEERQNDTLAWLFSQPIRVVDIVIGKFLSVWVMGVACLLPSLVYLYTLYQLAIPQGNLDLGMTLGSYLGTIVLIAGFSALGVLTSSLAKNQVIAYLFALFLNFIFWMGLDQIASYKLMGGLDFIIQNLGFQYHFSGFARGLVSGQDIFYFTFVSLLCLFLSTLVLEKKR